MIGLRVNVKGLPELEARLTRMDERLRYAPRNVIDQVGRAWLEAMKADAPRRSGRMADSLQFVLGARQATFSTGSFEGVDYTPFVIDGTRPHVILPRRARHLRFVIGGRVIFARRVRHPGTRPNPFPQRALERIFGRVEEILQRTGSFIVGD